MISEKAMLTAVHISIWTASKHDKQVSRDVANQHGAHQNAGRYKVELVDLLPNLNIAQDSNLTAFVEEIRNRLCGHSPDELRRDQSTRQSTAEAAAEIMKRMSAYIGEAR